MYRNKYKAKLKEGKKCCAMANATWFDATIAEMAGKAGFDAITLDCEHACVSRAQILEFIRACETADIIPVIRVSDNSPGPILQIMDAGAMGITIPDIHNAEEAKAAVDAVKYPPMGHRGLSTTRASDYGLGMKLSEYTKVANEETILTLMIENPDAVENIEEILAVPGIDCVVIGATDLSLSLGHPGNRNHPEVVAAINKVIAAAHNNNIPLGTVLRPGQDPKEEIAKGYRLMMMSISSILTAGMKKFIQQTQE